MYPIPKDLGMLTLYSHIFCLGLEGLDRVLNCSRQVVSLLSVTSSIPILLYSSRDIFAVMPQHIRCALSGVRPLEMEYRRSFDPFPVPHSCVHRCSVGHSVQMAVGIVSKREVSPASVRIHCTSWCPPAIVYIRPSITDCKFRKCKRTTACGAHMDISNRLSWPYHSSIYLQGLFSNWRDKRRMHARNAGSSAGWVLVAPVTSLRNNNAGAKRFTKKRYT
jgi:hypothetical protein